MNNLDVFFDRMKNLLGDEFEDFKESLSRPITKSLFVNQNKISINKFKEVVDFDIEPIPYVEGGFYVDGEKKGRHALHHAGAFYMQEPSAMFTVNAIKFKGNEYVLDMCAAPGGKSIQIANKIPNGILVSNEIVKSRAEILHSNIERMGLKNVIITNDNPKNIANAYGNVFDVVLVDAPCSGEGMFRRGDAVSDEWYPEINQMCAKRQIEILIEADKTLKKNGILIYSTCTYSVEENEGVVKEFLNNFNYDLINIDEEFPRGIDMPEAVRLYPHKVRGEGQFVAVLKKKDDNFNECSKSVKLSNSKITNDFLTKNLNSITLENVVSYDNISYYAPCKELIKKHIKYVSLGVKLGEIISNRFVPNHNLFTAFGGDFKTVLDLENENILLSKYLRGESLDVELQDGFGTVFAYGCAVGGFKVSQGKFKNYYPKGLRNF